MSEKHIQHIDEYIVDYLEDKLSSEEKVEVEIHLKGCVKCRELYQDFQKTFTLLKPLKERQLTPAYKADVLSRILMATAEQIKHTHYLNWLAPAIAVSIIIFFIVYPLLYEKNSASKNEIHKIISDYDGNEITEIIGVDDLLSADANVSDTLIYKELAAQTIEEGTFFDYNQDLISSQNQDAFIVSLSESDVENFIKRLNERDKL